jgi:hypothetical protein
MKSPPDWREIDSKVAALEIALIAFMEQAPDPATLLRQLDVLQRDPQMSRRAGVCKHLNRLSHALASRVVLDTPSPDTH